MRTPEFDRNAGVLRLRIPPALKEWAEGAAKEQGITLSRYTRTLIEKDREDFLEQLQKSHGMEYLKKIPASVPEGRVVVHNHVAPARRLGWRGFRAWLAKPNPDQLEVCPCGWARELGEHYRVVRRGT
jgi:hypothetical protein